MNARVRLHVTVVMMFVFASPTFAQYGRRDDQYVRTLNLVQDGVMRWNDTQLGDYKDRVDEQVDILMGCCVNEPTDKIKAAKRIYKLDLQQWWKVLDRMDEILSKSQDALLAYEPDLAGIELPMYRYVKASYKPTKIKLKQPKLKTEQDAIDAMRTSIALRRIEFIDMFRKYHAELAVAGKEWTATTDKYGSIVGPDGVPLIPLNEIWLCLHHMRAAVLKMKNNVTACDTWQQQWLRQQSKAGGLLFAKFSSITHTIIIRFKGA